jgi:hypothetical protein
MDGRALAVSQLRHVSRPTRPPARHCIVARRHRLTAAGDVAETNDQPMGAHLPGHRPAGADRR